MQKIISIVGPTASGKTKLAFQLAKHFNGALINADSVQIYKKLDIISGKDLPENKVLCSNSEAEYYQIDNIPLYLVDVVPPTSDFNVTDFIKKAHIVLRILEKEQKMPILVGGSGFYIKGLLEGIDTVVSPNKQLRKELSNLLVEELQAILKEKNPAKLQSLNNSDINNPRRLIRAIEISASSLFEKKELLPYDVLTIGLLVERDQLIHQIDERVDSRIEEGALDEAKDLFENYKELSSQVKSSNGYNQLFSYLRKELLFEEAVLKWKQREHQTAKKQMTFFKSSPDTYWFRPSDTNFESSVINYIQAWYNKK